MKQCDKCSIVLERNTDEVVKHQSISLYDEEIDLCNDCANLVFKFIKDREPFTEEENEPEGSDELFN